MSLPLTYDSADPLAIWDGPYLWDQQITINSTKIMPDIKVTYGVADVIGFCQGITDMVTGYKTDMVAKGIDPTATLTSTTLSQTDLSAKNNVQEGIKTQLRDQTPLVETARDHSYTLGSNLVDQVVAAFGKNSEQAKEAINLRKKLRPARSRAAANPTKKDGNAQK